jgi:co-chaperonin GroES (HSP10)
MPEYSQFRPILDRLLLKLVHEEQPKDGFDVPEKYRQHTNKGEILAIGDCVILSGHKMPMAEFVNIGDHVLFGEHTAERFASKELSEQFGSDELYIVRIQDIRGCAKRENA